MRESLEHSQQVSLDIGEHVGMFGAQGLCMTPSQRERGRSSCTILGCFYRICTNQLVSMDEISWTMVQFGLQPAKLVKWARMGWAELQHGLGGTMKMVGQWLEQDGQQARLAPVRGRIKLVRQAYRGTIGG